MADVLNGFFHHSSANLFGGQDLYAADGHQMGHTSSNIFGGHDTFDLHGIRTGHTADNVFGGHDTFDAHGLRVGYTMPTAGGGEVAHDAHGHTLGTFHGTDHAVSFHGLGGEAATFRANLMGGYTADPLNNMAHVQFPAMTW